jgi:hypothetical protein
MAANSSAISKKCAMGILVARRCAGRKAAVDSA